MAMDLGNLVASLEIDAAGAIRSLTDFGRKVEDTTRAVEGLDGKRIDVAPTGKRELDAAAGSARGLGEGLDKAGAAAGKMKPPTGISPALDKATGSAKTLGDELDRAGREASELAQSGGPTALNSALGGLAATARGLLPQITAVAAAGTIMSKGWDRVTGIDNATFKLKGLGHEAQSVEAIMGSALTSVRGTAFGLGDAATAAANAVASGVKPGAELTQVLTTMADTAAISGASLQDMGMIFNSVMAKGKLQGDDLLQLMGRGVPVLQMIGDQLGITAAEVSKMATDGAISFEIFEAAMREGVGGAAQAMGGSIEGSMQNAGAAIGRLGEALMKVVAEEGPSAIAGFTQSIDLLTTGVNAAYGAWEKVPGPVKAVVAALAAAKIAQVLLNTEMAAGLRLKVADGFTSAATGISTFASSLGEAYRNTRLANPEMGALSSGMSVLAGSGGVAATAMSGLKGAAGGLLSALGGPWGLAIGGATVALGMFMKHVQDTKQAQADAEAATQAWADVLRQADGAITDQVQSHAIAQVQALEMTDVFNRLGYTTADVAAAVLDLDGSYGPLIKHLDDVIKAGTDTESVQAKMSAKGYIMDGAAEEALEMRDALTGLAGQAREGAEAADDAADASNDLALKVAEAARAADQSTDSFDPLIGVFAAMEAEAKTVDDAIKNLANAMLRLSDDPSLQLQSYLSSAAQDLQKLRDALGKGMGGFDVDTGHFDVMNEQGQALHGTMMNLRTSVHEVAAAQYRLNKDMGVAGPEAAAMAAEAANELTAQMEAQLLAAGWTEEQVGALIDRYGMIPGDIMTHVQAVGVETATELINGLDERLMHIDQENYVLTVDADAINFTKEQAEELGYVWNDIGNNVIQLAADDENARNAIDDLVEKTKHLNTQKNTIVLRGDHKDVVDRLNEVEGMKAKLQTNPATLRVVADTEKAREGIEKLGLEAESLPDGNLFIHTNSDAEMKKLLNLGAETVSLPEGFIEITDTSQEVMKALELLGVEVKTLPDGRVVITDNSAKIRDDIDRNLSRHVLNRAGTVTLNIVENIRSVFSRSTGGSIPQRSTGGNIPRLAAGDRTHGGYRLPMTGPGTDRTDGILGLDAAGVPTAWVDRGEFVTNREATSKWLTTLMAINQDDPVAVLKAMLFDLPQLQNGGVLSASQIKAAMADMDNGRYVMGGFSTGATDCSGGVSAVVNTALGLPRFESRTATPSMGSWLANKGFQPGRGDSDDIVVGWYDYGGGANGHTSMRLQDGTYIESGGNTGQGFTIGGKAGSLDGRGYTNFMHLPYDSTADGGDGFLTGQDGARTSMGSGVSHRAEFEGVTPVSDSASGVGSTFGRSFHQPGLASNTTPTSVGSMLGGSIAGQITSMAEQHGLGQQASQLLGTTTNMEVFLRVTPETVAAFNKLGEAKADRENASYDVAEAERDLAEARRALTEVTQGDAEASLSLQRRLEDAQEAVDKARADGNSEKIADAEKKLARVREDIAADLEKQGVKNAKDAAKAQENVQKAQAKLEQAQRKEEKSIRDLAAAHEEFQWALQAAPWKNVAGLIGGLADSLNQLGETLEAVNKNADLYQQAQDAHRREVRAAADAELAYVRALSKSRDVSRKNATARWQDDLMVAQSTGRVSTANRELTTEQSYTLDMLGKISVEEAQRAWNEMERSNAEREASQDLEYAKAMLDIQTRQLELSTRSLTEAQKGLVDANGQSLSATGEALDGGGMFLDGLKDAALAFSAFFAAGGPANPIMGALAAAGPGISAFQKLVLGGTKVADNKDDAIKEFEKADDRTKVEIALAALGMVGGAVTATHILNNGGSQDDALLALDVVTDLGRLPLQIRSDVANMRAEAEQRRLDEEKQGLQRERDQLDLERVIQAIENANATEEQTAILYALLDQAKKDDAYKKAAAAQRSKISDYTRETRDELRGPSHAFFQLGGAGWGGALSAVPDKSVLDMPALGSSWMGQVESGWREQSASTMALLTRQESTASEVRALRREMRSWSGTHFNAPVTVVSPHRVGDGFEKAISRKIGG